MGIISAGRGWTHHQKATGRQEDLLISEKQNELETLAGRMVIPPVNDI